MASKTYTSESLEKALDQIKNGMSVYKASKLYKIPNQTLYDKVNEKYKRTSAGAPTILTSDEENLIVEWIIAMAKMGFPVTKDLLLHSVQKLIVNLGRKNKFKNGLPGRHWYEGFLKRHPSITKRVCQTLTTARIGVTEEKVKAWFSRVRQYFTENNMLEVLNDPSRIFNCDESAFYLNPKGQAVLTQKGTKSVYCKSGNDEKECLTLLLGASANGKLMPILALFPYKRIPTNIISKYPKSWSIGKSDNGWMTRENFYEYVANIFNPFLIAQNIQKPVILFLDGHISHLSLHLCQFCKENGIILVALLPNSTHALQPMDVAIFHSLKNAWSRDAYTWRMENSGNRMQREDFGPLLEKCINKTLRAETIINGFRKCGLYPFDEEAVDYNRFVISSTPNSSVPSTPCSITSSETSNATKYFIMEFEKNLGKEKLEEFEQCLGDWIGDIRDENLFYFWRKIKEIDGKSKTVSGLDTMELGNSTLEANNFSVSDLTINWLNENISMIDLALDDGDLTLVPNSIDQPPISKINPVEITPNLSQTFTPASSSKSVSSNSINNAVEVPDPTESRDKNFKNSKNSYTPPSQINSTEGQNKAQSPIPQSQQFPSPFKNALLWPETPKSSKNKKNIRKKLIPTVATCEEYIEYQKRLEKEKQDKLEKSELRKKKQEERKNYQQKEGKKKEKKAIKTNISEKLEKSLEGLNDETESKSGEEELEMNSLGKKSISSGDFVIVNYEGEKFPGQVIEELENKKTFMVKTMIMTGFSNGKVNWRWPDKEDILDYDFEDIIKKINPPIPVTKRGVFSILDFD